MKLIKRLKHTSEKNKIVSELDILIYPEKIIWYLAETDQYYNADEFTEDQPIDNYLKNGPPSFASNITDEIIKEISEILQGK